MTDIKPSYNMDCGGNCFTDKPKVMYLYVESITMQGDDLIAYNNIVRRLTPQQGGYLPLVVLRVWSLYKTDPYAGPALSVHMKTADGTVDEEFLPPDVDFSTVDWQNVA